MRKNGFIKTASCLSFFFIYNYTVAQVPNIKSGNTDLNLLPVYDLDNNKYTVIKIGNRYWFKENLRTTQYNDTTPIRTGLTDSEWKLTNQGAFAIYENNPLYKVTYGNLYNGFAVRTGKLCPKGWRVPTDNDWKELENFLGVPVSELDRTGERGGIADKLKTVEGWKVSSFVNNNSSGFSILPAGSRQDNGEYSTLNQYGNFWTSSVYDDRYGLLYLWNHHVHYNTHAVGRIYTLANNGYSCRCVKNETETGTTDKKSTKENTQPTVENKKNVAGKSTKEIEIIKPVADNKKPPVNNEPILKNEKQPAANSTTEICNGKPVAQTAGIWKEGKPGSIKGVSAESLAKQKEFTGNLVKQLKQKYNPEGFNIGYSGVYGYDNPALVKNRKADSYELSMPILPLYCENGKIKQQPETSFWLNVMVNKIPVTNSNSFFVPKTVDEEDPETDLLYQIDNKPVKDRGTWLLKRNFIGSFVFSRPDNTLTEFQWFFSYDDRLPFRYVSQKELCNKLLAYFQKKIKFTSSEDDIAFLQKKTGYIEDYLGKTALSELNKPAIIRGSALAAFDQYEDAGAFYQENDSYTSWVVEIDKNYFNASLPMYTPQLITVKFSVQEQNLLQLATMNKILDALDFSSLKKMLGNPNPFGTAKTQPEKAIGPGNTIATTASIKPAITYDIYKNVPEKGFMQTAVAQIKNVVSMPAIKPAVKEAAMKLNMTDANRMEILKKLLFDIQNQLSVQQVKEMEKLPAQLNRNWVDLADLGVMLFYKGNTAASYWCLAQAAAMDPTNDYILNNLSGILTTSGAASRALPILKYLRTKYPTNTTVLNNLGQAWFSLGEIAKSKSALDSCLRFMGHHPQANYTRAAIAEKEGKNREAISYLQKSVKLIYSDGAADLAQKKKIKIDWGNYMNLRRPAEVNYINPLKLKPPAQCTNIYTAKELEGEWKAWSEAVQRMTLSINAGVTEAAVNYEKETDKWVKASGKPGAVYPYQGIMQGKADKQYKNFLKRYSDLSEGAIQYFNTKYQPEENALELAKDKAIKIINEKYARLEGEGKGDQSEAKCKEIDAVSNTYLQKMAALNDDFNSRYSEPMRMLAIEMMFWSQYLPEPSHLREAKYYEMALKAVQPLMMNARFIYPCGTPSNPATAKKKDTVSFMPYCPISFKFKIKVVKVTGDCGKLEFEFEAGGFVLGIEKDFINRKSTLAFGVGASLDFEKDDIVGKIIPQIIDVTGAGAGVKAQAFIEFNSDGSFSDTGIRGEASLEGPLTDKGDIKINGKIGVNAGIDVTASDAAKEVSNTIAGTINDLAVTIK